MNNNIIDFGNSSSISSQEKFNNGLSDRNRSHIVDKFTPYTEKDRERNFSPFFGGDKRPDYEQNPSYLNALRQTAKSYREKGKEWKARPSWFTKEMENESIMKNTVKLTESQLHRVIKESVEMILREYGSDFKERLLKYGNLNDDDIAIMNREEAKQKAQRAKEEEALKQLRR